MKKYQVVNGTRYSENTPAKVIKLLEEAIRHNFRIRVFYGDTETGRDWMEENGTIGTIGRSTGEIKIPLLIKTKRSIGGGSLLDGCIVKITMNEATMYQHEKYHLPEMKILPATEHLQEKGYTHTAFVFNKGNFEIHANFKSQEQAAKWVDFIRGKRNSK